MPPTNYIYLDYDNIREVDLSVIKGHPARFILALGPHVKNLPLDLVEQLLKFPSKVRLLKSTTAGHNALDLLIGKDLGAQSVRDPEGVFHIISKDKDFDSLIKNLAQEGTSVVRRESFAQLQLAPANPPSPPKNSTAVPSVAHCAARLAESLAKNAKNRPRTITRLRGVIRNHFKHLTPTAIDEAVHALEKSKTLTLDNGKITYPANLE